MAATGKAEGGKKFLEEHEASAMFWHLPCSIKFSLFFGGLSQVDLVGRLMFYIFGRSPTMDPLQLVAIGPTEACTGLFRHLRAVPSGQGPSAVIASRMGRRRGFLISPSTMFMRGVKSAPEAWYATRALTGRRRTQQIP